MKSSSQNYWITYPSFRFYSEDQTRAPEEQGADRLVQCGVNHLLLFKAEHPYGY